MKSFTLFISLIVACITMSHSMFSLDVPKTMSYQAVIRNGSQGLVINSTVTVRISILKLSEFGSPAYVERHSAKTNANGLLSLQIGAGTPLLGTFQTIDWSDGPYFLRTETDPQGGTEYGITSVSQILTVPYAIHANKAMISDSVKHEKDPLFSASVAASITSQDTARWNTARGEETDPVFMASVLANVTEEHLSKWDSAIVTETDPIFKAWDKSYEDLTKKPITDGSETKISAGRNISVTGNGTMATPYSISHSPSVLTDTIQSTNTLAIQNVHSLIVIQSNNDGAIDKITLPQNAIPGQVLYLYHKRGTQGDSPEINLSQMNGIYFTYVYADGAWHLFAEY